MTAVPILLSHRTAARTRAALDTAATGAPIILAAAAVGWRLFGLAGIVGAVMVGLAVLGGLIVQRDRRFDLGWLIGQLDARIPRFEDSTALLFRQRADLTGLAGLQRVRLEARVDEAKAVDLRPVWSQRSIAIVWAASVVVIACALFWPETSRSTEATSGAARPGSSAPAPAIAGTRLRITPPAYTGLPVREQTALDARVPEGSRIEWMIGFDPHPASATLEFPEGRPVALVRDGAMWTGATVADVSRLYRIEADGLARQRLNRIDVAADAPPVVRLVEPERQLVIVTPGQTAWSPVFEASDDYGVVNGAELRITVTKGDGENITYERRSRSITGTGDARRLRFSAALNMAAEGMQPGSDLIVQLVVSDNRSPERHRVEGPSVILRWPANLPMADGLDGMAMRTMPAYFASQRQIIINAEALIAERRRLAPAAFSSRSNGIGEEQAQLRLRYGQFMGEEAEGGGSGGGIALPTNDAPAPSRPTLPASDTPPVAAEAPGHDDHDDHDEDHAGEGATFGAESDVLHEFGHAHDTAEAATLFAPATRSALARSLDAMWSSERELRQGRPEAALPFANQALELLKEAQRATRIFLGRVGSDLPPVDFARRLTGEREDIVADTPSAPARDPADAAPADAWRALDERPGAPPLALGGLERWVRANAGRLPDPLALTAAIDTVRNEPGCMSCRRTLRALLWTALERPPVAVRRRGAPGRDGQRYLDALR
ncbi:MAG: DUF4175 family protein [Pseudomonadota bacterium]